MNQKKLLQLIVCFSVFLLPFLSRAEGPWLESYNEAVKKADEEKKGLLLLFTCTEIELCQKFEEKILTSEEFLKPVTEKLVLVKLDYPKSGTFPPEEAEKAKQLQLLKDAYRVQGFPSVVITDSGARLFGLNGFQPVGPKLYAETCVNIADTMSDKIDKFKKAAELEGLERAELLVEAIPVLPGNMAARFFAREMRAVIAADPENKTGKVDDYQLLITDVAYSNQMALLSREQKWKEMVSLTNHYIQNEKLEGTMLQIALMNRFGALQKLGDQEGMIRTMLQVVEVDPESRMGKDATAVLKKWRQNRLDADKEKGEAEPSGEKAEDTSKEEAKPAKESEKTEESQQKNP